MTRPSATISSILLCVAVCVTVALGRPTEEVQMKSTLLRKAAPNLEKESTMDYKETLLESEVIDSLLALSAKEAKTLKQLLFDNIATPVATQDLHKKLASEEQDLFKKLTSDQQDLVEKLTSDTKDLVERLSTQQTKQLLENLKLAAEGELTLADLLADQVANSVVLTNWVGQLTSEATEQLVDQLESLAKNFELSKADLQTKLKLSMAAAAALDSIPNPR